MTEVLKEWHVQILRKEQTSLRNAGIEATAQFPKRGDADQGIEIRGAAGFRLKTKVIYKIAE